MPKTKIFRSFGLILIWVFLLLPSTLAAATQWFPAVGTVCDYKVQIYFNWSNGTNQLVDKFTIYNHSNTVEIVPNVVVQLEPDSPASWEVLEENVEVFLQHKYLDLSSTSLNMTTKITANASTFEGNLFNIDFVLMRDNSSKTWYPFSIDPEELDKIGFYDTISSMNFIDHLDISLGVGEIVIDSHSILAITDDCIIAKDTYGVVTFNNTYVADKNGRIKSFTKSNQDPGMLFNYNIKSTSYQFARVVGSSTIPSYPMMFLVAISSLTVLLITSKVKLKKQ